MKAKDIMTQRVISVGPDASIFQAARLMLQNRISGLPVVDSTGALIGMGIPEFEARKYEGKVKSGSSLISVHSEDSEETQRAKDIFERAGASDITSAGEIAVASSGRA